jgi:signal transduction histidine kinase
VAKRKSRIKCLLMSSQKGANFLQPVIKEILIGLDAEVQLDLFTDLDRNVIVHSRQIEKDLVGTITSSDLILVDFNNISILSFFEIGIARAIGKPIVFIAENVFTEELPDLIRQSYFVFYTSNKELRNKLQGFFAEYLENPKRFTPSRLIDSDTSTQIVVDLEKLEPRVFENLCFELLSRLGYKQLEWKVKEEFVDAVTTLRKQDPDGFEYDELWLISFMREFMNDKLLDMAIHEPDYFFERIYRDIYPDMMNRSGIMQGKADVPITLLLILRGKENYTKRLSRELSRRDSRMNKRGYPFTIRIRWWDEQNITSLVQKNLPLARKYFSSEALVRSGIRLSYEELYRQYADMNEELQNTNQLLIAERNKIELLERDAAWKLLSFTAAHRLGNPLDAIDSELSNLRQALEMGKTEMVNEIVKSMEIPIERAKSIISEFRNLSLAQELKPEEIKSEQLDKILKYSAKRAMDKNVDVVFDLKKVPDISIDIQKLSDCFGELVSNSLHFLIGDNQQISISVNISKTLELPDKIDRTKEYIVIIFSDNGCGVPFEKKNEIFKPFETSYIHGTGLGLAYCESIIERHGGKIREIGKPNEGAIFEIFLPITQNKEKTN